MKDRMQPIVKGLTKKGELRWGKIPMPLWQRAMFPIRYAGDFFVFWMKRVLADQTGYEGEELSNFSVKNAKTHRRHHRGD